MQNLPEQTTLAESHTHAAFFKIQPEYPALICYNKQ